MKTVYSIYSDGNYFPRAKKSGFGGYIEDPTRQVLVEYTEQIRQPQYAFSFELLGIIRGLQLAQSMGLKHIVSYCDDKTTMAKLEEVLKRNGDTSFLTENAKPELYDEIINLSKQFTSSDFQYIPRAKNKHSDSLSRRYAGMMEKNFIRQYEDELDNSENLFKNSQKPTKKMFFSHPSLVRMKEKNNPFLVANYRNKKARKISRAEQRLSYNHLFVEIIKESEKNFNLKAFYYSNGDENTKQVISEQFFSNSDIESGYCHFLAETLNKAANIDKTNLWVYSNVVDVNKILEQKEKFNKTSFINFSKVNQALNLFERVTYHSLPFKHEFSPEIAIQEAKKEELDGSIESVESLIEQLQQGALGREHNKYFGKLISYQLRNYQEQLKRELNDIEKQSIIKKTTEDLENLGLTALPKVKNYG